MADWGVSITPLLQREVARVEFELQPFGENAASTFKSDEEEAAPAVSRLEQANGSPSGTKPLYFTIARPLTDVRLLFALGFFSFPHCAYLPTKGSHQSSGVIYNGPGPRPYIKLIRSSLPDGGLNLLRPALIC